jgi:hypothetical protein
MWRQHHPVTSPALVLDLGIMPTVAKNDDQKEGIGSNRINRAAHSSKATTQRNSSSLTNEICSLNYKRHSNTQIALE